MAGIGVKIQEKGFDRLALDVSRLSALQKMELAAGIGRLVQEQTRRRIEEEKTSPDGGAWPQNHAGSSLLDQSGALSRSIDYKASPDQITIGSRLVYARIHQKGGVIKAKNARFLRFQLGNRLVYAKQVSIPARPYLGLSADNRLELIQSVEDWFGEVLQ